MLHFLNLNIFLVAILFTNISWADGFCTSDSEIKIDGEITKIADQDKEASGDLHSGVIYDLDFKTKEGAKGSLNNIYAPVFGGLSIGDQISFEAECFSGNTTLEWKKWSDGFLEAAKNTAKQKIATAGGWCHYNEEFIQVKGYDKKPVRTTGECECNGSPAEIMKNNSQHKKISEKKGKDGKPQSVIISFPSRGGGGEPLKVISYYYRSPSECDKALITLRAKYQSDTEKEKKDEKKKFGDYE